MPTSSPTTDSHETQLKRPFKATPETMTVVKRSGVIVPFHEERIANAIHASFCDTHKVAKESALPDELEQAVFEVTRIVVEELCLLTDHGHSLTVEGIQDLVEKKLMENGFHEEARDYIIYRDEHQHLRESKSQNIQVLRSDQKTIVRFNPIKIGSLIERAFRHTLAIVGTTPAEVVESVNELTQTIIATLLDRDLSEPIATQEIQDEIENELMAWGYFKEAKYLILQDAKTKAPQPLTPSEKNEPTEEKEQFSLKDFLNDVFSFATKGFPVDKKTLIKETTSLTFEGISQKEALTAAVLAVKAKIELEPIYSKIAANILLDALYRETLSVSGQSKDLEKTYRTYFISYMESAKKSDTRLNPELADFDLKKLADALDLKRDLTFSYLGLQTLYDRYFIHENQKRLETPQIFWMRVAMGLALSEGKEKTERAIEFYGVLSQFYYLSGTPTLFNSGTMHSQLSSCYLSTVEDDLHNIFKIIADDAQLSKWAGGIGNDWTPIRATGSLIKGTNGTSQGVIPFLKIVNDTAVAVNQGGKRKGAACVYLESWHLDIEDFIELKKNTGDDRRRTHDINTANWIPDLFMKRVMEEGKWTLFSPQDVPDLHDLYGTSFEKKYVEYEKKTKSGQIKLFKEIDAMDLWRKMLSMLFETGHPWITFKDPSNLCSTQDHVGVVHSSNLCTEILLNTSKDETAVCNLGSINLARHTSEAGLNVELLEKTVRTAVRMLDNVIDINFYPVQEARNSNLKHRPIGLGVMGLQDSLYIQKISFASHKAVQFSDEFMELISYFAISASSDLAKERGAYSSFKGSKWDRGLLPIDTWKEFVEYRGKDIEVDQSSRLDWDSLRKKVQKQGMRNSNTMAIAPTATIANIADVTPAIEPTYKHLFVKSNLSGEFTVINPHLVQSLKDLNIWDEEMIDDLKYFDGNLSEIQRIPQEIKLIYLTAFEIEPEWLIEAASRRQKWVDMGQSLNLFLNEPSGKKMHNMYFLAWKRGLKTTYYCRTLGATQIEKSSTDINKRGLQPRWMKNTSASAAIKVERKPKMPTVCNLEEGCESCQ
jgi:ribonucleoside-diphosphate reductase alpha chain